jgi:hypothetical protein
VQKETKLRKEKREKAQRRFEEVIALFGSKKTSVKKVRGARMQKKASWRKQKRMKTRTQRNMSNKRAKLCQSEQVSFASAFEKSTK